MCVNCTYWYASCLSLTIPSNLHTPWLGNRHELSTLSKRRHFVLLFSGFERQEVLQVLHAKKDTVVAVFAGHDHDGGFSVADASN